MNRKNIFSRAVWASLAIAAVVTATVITMGSLAPTTEGLILQATSQIGTAAVGNGNEAFILVSAYNAAGSVRGLATGSFGVTVVAAPANAAPLKKVAMTEPASGVYKISLTPELSSQRWVSGKYILAITLTSANGSGVTLAEMVIP